MSKDSEEKRIFYVHQEPVKIKQTICIIFYWRITQTMTQLKAFEQDGTLICWKNLTTSGYLIPLFVDVFLYHVLD